MRVVYLTFEGTPAEFAESPLAALAHSVLADRDGAPASGSPLIVRLPQPATPDEDGTVVPGVPADGQQTVQQQLRRNPASGHLTFFLSEATTWPNVRVHGKKRRGARASDPLDFTDYLRLRRTGSPVGGFAYVWPDSGVVLFRLPALDERSRDIAPAAVETSAGHRQYRVKITIADGDTLAQAIELARLAYEAT